MSSACVYAITGASGFVGRRLSRLLLEYCEDARIVCIDIRLPSQRELGEELLTNEDRIQWLELDICNTAGISSALTNNKFGLVSCVIHLASYGMSGLAQFDQHKIEIVNINATKDLTQLCLQNGVRSFVYCSSYNAVFYGQEIINGSEPDIAYPPLHKHVDFYSRSKTQMEQYVLNLNDTPFPEQKVNDKPNINVTFKTCAIRPAAIYGDGEQRHFPRIIEKAASGLCYFACGARSNLVDWVYADNLAFGIIRAAQRCLDSNPNVCGKTFCISDGEPVNNFQFIAEILTGLGYNNVFTFYLPTTLFFVIAYILELLCWFIKFVTCNNLEFTPFLTRVEVYKIGVTHYFSMKEAKKHLGYIPIVDTKDAIDKCVEYYKFKSKEMSSRIRHPDHPD